MCRSFILHKDRTTRVEAISVGRRSTNLPHDPETTIGAHLG